MESLLKQCLEDNKKKINRYLHKEIGTVTPKDIKECGILEDEMSMASINDFAEIAWVDPFPQESNGT